MGGTDNLQDLDRPQLAAGADQRADGAQLQPERGAVLGRPRQGPQGAGRRPDRQPRRDGVHARARGRRARVDSAVRRRVHRGVRHRHGRHRRGDRGHRRVRGDAGDAEFALRQMAEGRRAGHHRGRAGRLQAVQGSGCTACHNGPAVGGASFQKMGVVEPYKTDSPARRPRGGDRQGRRPLQLQGADAAQRRTDLSLLPRWRGQHADRGGRHHGARATGQDVHAGGKRARSSPS